MTTQPPTESYTVLLPVLNTDEAIRLLPIAAALARRHTGRVLMSRIVLVPADQPLSDGMLDARRVRAELDAMSDAPAIEDVPVRQSIRVAHSLAEGIVSVARDERASVVLLGWQDTITSPERLFGPPIDDLLGNPPCDVIVVRLHSEQVWEKILLPVRGGPHTPLSIDIAQALAERDSASITLLYASNPRQPDDAAARERLRTLRELPHIERWIERDIPASQAIMQEAADHDAIVIGVSGRPNDGQNRAGQLADRVLREAKTSVVLVRHRMEQAEEQAQTSWERQRDLSAAVDRWFAENTFSSTEFDDLRRLVALKQQRGLTISLGLPALNEEETIGDILEQTLTMLVHEVPLLDEVVLIDSRSSDRTREIAASLGVPVHIHQDILPQYGSFHGKGEALWKSLYVLKGDIVAWVDTDIRNFHPRFVYGIVAPLLREPQLLYCKGFYRRPISVGGALASAGGGRVTELTARPLFNLFYPELSGMLQPLAGEYAAHRRVIESVPFFTGYGVETGLLIDILERHGLNALAQVDLHQRVHRNQELQPLSKMAFAITQVVMQRLESRQRVHLLEPVNQSMKLIQYAEGEGFHLDVREIRDRERPPMDTIPEYRALRGTD